MTSQPTTEIPLQPIRFLTADDDVDTELSTFAPGATVVDDGRTYVGEQEIRGWRERTRSGSEFTFTRSFLGLEPAGPGVFVARYRLEGDFPGGVVDLRHTFTVRGDGLVTALEIAP